MQIKNIDFFKRPCYNISERQFNSRKILLGGEIYEWDYEKQGIFIKSEFKFKG